MHVRWWLPLAGLGLLIGCEDPEKQDYDGDGFIGMSDCNDLNSAIAPDAREVCDGIDNDCDGLVDDEDDSVDLETERPWYADLDGDGFGDATNATIACGPPEAHVIDDDDCDDDNADIHPDAVEVCNDGVDDNCNGFADDADPALDSTTGSVFWGDLDGDGFGDLERRIEACVQPPETSTVAGDCADLDPAINPDAQEVCNALDDDCDGDLDDEDDSLDLKTRSTFYLDTDGDLFGDTSKPIEACAAPKDHVALDGDCDVGNPDVYPGAPEVCNNGRDDDCNTYADDEDPNLLFTSTRFWFPDGDGDGYGVPDGSVRACARPLGYAGVNTDCDDAARWTNPGAPERCNEVDDDCDKTTDPSGVWFYNADLDLWIDETAGFTAGTDTAPHAFTAAAAGELNVCDGTWYAHVTASSDLDVIGREPAAVLDGGYAENALQIPVVDGARFSDLVIEEITIQNGWGGLRALEGTLEVRNATVRDHADFSGFGIAQSVGNLVLEQVVLTGNDGFSTVETEDSAITMRDVTFDANTSTLLTWFNTSSVDAEDVLAENNSTFYGLYHFRGGAQYERLTSRDNFGVLGTGIYLTDSFATLDDSTIARNNAADFGGALYVTNGSSLFAEDVVIEDNIADAGAGVFMDGSNLNLERVSFLDNSSSGIGGAINATGGRVDLDDVTMAGNDGLEGGAASLQGGFHTIEGSTLTGNSAVFGGGAVYQGSGASVTCEDSTLSLNTADEGGAVSVFGGVASLTRVTIRDNRADFDGGGLYQIGGTVTMADGTVSLNDASQGAGLYLLNPVASTLTNVTVTGNTGGDGGGLYQSGGTVTVDGSTISTNEGDLGGGIAVSSGTCTITDTTITGNSALFDGGGLYQTGGTVSLTDSSLSLNDTFGFGGGSHHAAGAVTALRVVYDGNDAVDGGGMHVEDGTADLDDVDFTSNDATDLGGGLNLFLVDSATLDGVDVVGNTADSGAGIDAAFSALTIRDSTITDNTSVNGGGGVGVVLPEGPFVMAGTTVARNETTNNVGGGLFLDGGTHEITNSLVTDNEAIEGAGGYLAPGTVATCTSDLTGNHGFTDNVNDPAFGWQGAGVTADSTTFVFAEGPDVRTSRFESVGCDFGTAAGGDDNTPDDVDHVQWTADCTSDPCVFTLDAVDTESHDNDASFCIGVGCPVVAP